MMELVGIPIWKDCREILVILHMILQKEEDIK